MNQNSFLGIFKKGSLTSPNSKFMYINLNEKIERITKWLCIDMLQTWFIVAGIGCFVYSYINFFIFDMKAESFILPIPVMYVLLMMFTKKCNFSSQISRVFRRLSWNWKTPLAYAITFPSLTLLFYSLYLSLYQTLSSFAASCWLIFTFTQDITNDLKPLNVGGKSKQGHKKIRLCEINRQHSRVKQLSTKGAFYPFVWCVVFFAMTNIFASVSVWFSILNVLLFL